jgi:hypothetical protein
MLLGAVVPAPVRSQQHAAVPNLDCVAHAPDLDLLAAAPVTDVIAGAQATCPRQQTARSTCNIWPPSAS